MKFFRQTKETKRKISFFMALAMVISLLPVSPVAKAANKATLTVYSNVSGAAVTAESTSTGSAIITLTSEDTTKQIESAKVTAKTVSENTASTSSAVKATASVTVSGTAAAITPGCINANNAVQDGKVIITVSNITQNDTIILNGTITLTDKTTDETPGETPGETPDEGKCTVKINKSSLGANMSLSVKADTKEVADNAKVDKNTVLDIEVSPAENYICKTAPKLEVSSGASITTEIAEVSGKYTAKVTVTADATITVSGGEVTKVEASVEIPEDNANGATVNESIKSPEVLDSIMNAFVGVNPVSGSTVSNIEGIKALLAVTGSSIKTSFDVTNKDDYSVTDSEASKLASSATRPEGVTISDEDVVKMLKAGAVLDITINSILTSGDTVIKTTVTKLSKAIEITMNIPESIKGTNRTYYAIRIHEGKATILPCTSTDDGKIKFSSDEFSTYVISFVEKKDTGSNPSNPGGSTGSSGGIGSYVPSNSATPAPSATAAPSASPSADPSATPGVDNTAAPSESGAPSIGGDTTPTNAPAATDKPNDTDKDDNNNGGSTAVKVGKKATVSGSQYKVTAVKGTRTVQFTKGKKNAKSIVVPSTVKISGKNYKVTTIAKNAFKGNKKLAKVTIGKNVNKIGASAFQNCSKLKSIVIKSTKLTAKKVGKNAFKGINKKATFKVPKSKVKAYKKIVKAKGAGKNVKVKK